MTTRINLEGSYEAPALGDTYFHRLNTRIQLIRKDCDIVKALILKSVNCERKDIEFSLVIPNHVHKNTK